MIGVNHMTAPVEVRERLSFSEEEIVGLVDSLRSIDAGAEAVVLSTCNRTELYVNLDREIDAGDLDRFRESLCRMKSCDGDLVRSIFYGHIDRSAVEHLLRVVSGLDSMVLGENQVLGQVKDAYGVALSRQLTSTVMNRLFHLAFSVGKQVRTETGINEGASSASYAAVELASRIFDRLADHPVALIGAGETGVLVLESLTRRGCSRVCVVNRSVDRARRIAARFGADVADFGDLESTLTGSDIVVTSTSAAQSIIDRDLLEPIMKRRRNRPLFLIDLSVPRNISDDVKSLDEVFLYDIDDLELVVAHNRRQRAGEVERAEVIVREATSRFFDWIDALDLSPTIRNLKRSIDAIGIEELAKLSNRLTTEEYERIERYANYLKGKYHGMLVKRLRELTGDRRRLDYIEFVRELFELETEDRP